MTIRRRGLLAGALLLMSPRGHGQSITSGGSRRATFRVPTNVTGLKTFKTTGSVLSGSQSLTVADATGFSINDPIIVEVGGEAGGGAYGSVGVGGTWPTLSYTNATTRDADHSQALNTFAYIQTDNSVWQWNGSAWVSPGVGQYYINAAIPLALQTTTTNIVGNTLTLAVAASATTTNANVYFDNAPGINAQINGDISNKSLSFAAGNFAVGSAIQPSLLVVSSNYSFIGAGRTKTIFFSPKGSPSAMVFVENTNNGLFCDFKVIGNALLSGYGLARDKITQTSVPGDAYTRGLHIQLCQSIRVERVDAQDAWRSCVEFDICNSCSAHDCVLTRTGPLGCYIQWGFEIANSSNCSMDSCSHSAPYLDQAFEIFQSSYCSYSNINTHNGVLSVNSSGGWTIDTVTQTFASNSQYLSAVTSPFSTDGPCVVIDAQFNPSYPNLALGGTFSNFSIDQSAGYVNASNDSLQGVLVSTNNVAVKTGTYTAPNYAAPSTLHGALGVRSDSPATNTQVSGVTVNGLASGAPWYNIMVADGSVHACTAASILCTGPSCVLS